MHGVFPVDCENSIVEWTGRNLLNKHSGKIRLASGFLQFEDGLFTGGEFLLDMDSLSCDDLAGSPLHDVLIGHLKNEDFFDVPNHPTASILVTEATTVPGATPGSPNVSIVADLTLRGETHPVEFMAAAGLTDGGKPAAQASFSVDRTRWGAIYGSGKFFQRLAMHLVHDLVDIQVKVVAR
jgi:polyisoprenoid-binding protein YceI